MLPPDYLLNRASKVEKLYSDLQTAILVAIAARIAKVPEIIESTRYQIWVLMQAGMLREDIIKAIAKTNKQAVPEVRKLFKDAAVTSHSYDSKVYTAAGFDPLPIDQSPELLQILEAGVSKALGSVENLTGTTAILAEQKLLDTLNEAYNKTVSGGTSYDEAISEAIDELAQQGLPRYDYNTGRSTSLEAATRRAVLTGANQTAAQITEKTMNGLGVYLVRTSAHQGARNKGTGFVNHQQWQGRIFLWKEKQAAGEAPEAVQGGPNADAVPEAIQAEKVLHSGLNGGTLSLPDVIIGRSVGAKARNFDVMLPNGEIVHLTEGTRITNIEVIAGKGRNRQIDMVDILVDRFGGSAETWQKVKGFAHIDYNGESLLAELHWYKEPTAGDVLWKLKPQKGGEYFIDED